MDLSIKTTSLLSVTSSDHRREYLLATYGVLHVMRACFEQQSLIHVIFFFIPTSHKTYVSNEGHFFAFTSGFLSHYQYSISLQLDLHLTQIWIPTIDFKKLSISMYLSNLVRRGVVWPHRCTCDRFALNKVVCKQSLSVSLDAIHFVL